MPQKNQLLYSWFSTNFVDIDRFMKFKFSKKHQIKAIHEKTENQAFAEFKYHKKTNYTVYDTFRHILMIC